MVVGRQERRQQRSGAAVRAWQRDRGGASRGDAGAESWFENGWKTAAIREESESGDFFFLISMPVGPFVEAYQHASGRNGRPTHDIIVKKRGRILAPLLLITVLNENTKYNLGVRVLLIVDSSLYPCASIRIHRVN